jgi:hypothetical protein
LSAATHAAGMSFSCTPFYMLGRCYRMWFSTRLRRMSCSGKTW